MLRKVTVDVGLTDQEAIVDEHSILFPSSSALEGIVKLMLFIPLRERYTITYRIATVADRHLQLL